jgi:hypothetical protein
MKKLIVLLFIFLCITCRVQDKKYYPVQGVINLGKTPGDRTGDPLRTALMKCNGNFEITFYEIDELKEEIVFLKEDIKYLESKIRTLQVLVDAGVMKPVVIKENRNIGYDNLILIIVILVLIVLILGGLAIENHYFKKKWGK